MTATTSRHRPGCDEDPTEVWDDDTHRYCSVCGALLAIWGDGDDGWTEVA